MERNQSNLFEGIFMLKAADSFNDADYYSPETICSTVPDDYREVRDKILGAIRDDFCTARGIKIFLGVSQNFNLFPYLDRMKLDRDIFEIDSGINTAYFEREQIPAKFILGGAGGRVICVREGKPLLEPSPEITKITSKSWRKMSNAPLFNKPITEKPKPEDRSEAEARQIGNARKPVDYKLLETLVAGRKSCPEICEALAIHRNTYYTRLKTDEDFKEAVRRGKWAQGK
jgi:hypothetical protein